MVIKELNEIVLAEIKKYEFEMIGPTDEVITRQAKQNRKIVWQVLFS